MNRPLSLAIPIVLGLCVPAAASAAPFPPDDRLVFVANGLDVEQTVVLGAALSASRHPGLFLMHTKRTQPHLRQFLQSFKPSRIVTIQGKNERSTPAQPEVASSSVENVSWSGGAPLELWSRLLPDAQRVVVCPPRPYRKLLQAACLAGAARAPLYIYRDTAAERVALYKFLRERRIKYVYAVGDCGDKHDVAGLPWQVKRFPTEKSVVAAYVRRMKKRGPVVAHVVANPYDRDEKTTLSPLAPWLAGQRRGVLTLTNASGSNVVELIERAEKRYDIVGDLVLIAADLEAIPVERRLNPVRGKDEYIEMEPTTPTGLAPYSHAVGRLFHEDPAFVPLILAGERLLQRRGPQRPRALVASNSADELPLLETLSRTTAKELQNRGFDTCTLFGDDVNPGDLRRLLPRQDIFVWEGHHNTLIKNYGFAKWDERLQPSLFFLQSCLILQPEKTAGLFERGALGVVGASTRIYSASGGAFTLSYFDAILYEKRTLGGALRHAKNFMVCYAMLKEKRLGADARLTSINLRSAWAFSLWGDPALRFPMPARPDEALPHVRHRLVGNSIRIKLPEEKHEARTKKYEAHVPANGRLAGLVVDDKDRRDDLVPMIFVEIALPDAKGTPRLRGKLPGRDWVFNWDARRKVGYLLVRPPSGECGELRFTLCQDETAELTGAE